jgi:cell wall hydrolase
VTKTLYKLFILPLATLAFLVPSNRLLGHPEGFVGPFPFDPDAHCMVNAVYHEARGEPVKGQRAVVDVIHNRAAKSGKSVCEVVAEPHQFTWYRKKPEVPLTSEHLAFYNAALHHPKVLTSENFIFFGKHPFGTKCVRIASHRFCQHVPPKGNK